jgi:DNA-binding transcriptional MerR regulator
MAERIPIGRFSRLTGLTVKALRHYDAVGLLRPAGIDTVSRHRWYAPEQVERGRVVRRLRMLELPLEEIRGVLSAPDGGRGRLLAYRRDVEARLVRDQRILHQLTHLIEGDRMTAPPDRLALPAAEQRQLAADLFNLVWELLETKDRSTEQDDTMVHAAHASRYHWGEVGKPENRGRGEWQCSRVYSVLDRPEPALHHARRCLEICEQHGLADFDLAAAYEALARAHAVAGERDEAARYVALGRDACEQIAEDEDRQIILADLASVPI